MIKLLSVGAAALMAVSATATAAESEYSGTVCGFSKINMLQSSPDVAIFTIESWGMQTPDSTFKPWANGTVHCVEYDKVIQGKGSSMGSCQWTDNTGDTFTGESTKAPDTTGVWTFLGGTGKWKGVSGGGTWKIVSLGKPGPDGSNFCFTHIGKYTLPE